MTVGKDAITIRDLHLEELSLVREIGKHAFSLPMGLLMAATVSPQGLAAEDGTGTIIGALTLRTVSVGNCKVGILDWAVVDPPHQGQGIGKALIDQALVWLPQQGCDKIITTGVDGYNSASWNAAHAQGLRSWPVSQQIREFGWYWFKLLLVIPHIGVSTFILHLPSNEQERQELPATSSIWTLIGVMLLLGVLLTSTQPSARGALGKYFTISPTCTAKPHNHILGSNHHDHLRECARNWELVGCPSTAATTCFSLVGLGPDDSYTSGCHLQSFHPSFWWQFLHPSISIQLRPSAPRYG